MEGWSTSPFPCCALPLAVSGTIVPLLHVRASQRWYIVVGVGGGAVLRVGDVGARLARQRPEQVVLLHRMAGHVLVCLALRQLDGGPER